MMRPLLLLLTLSFFGCGEDDNPGSNSPGDDCNSCGESELCVIEFGEEREERCEPIPEVCNGVGACADTECTSAMYDYCPDETSAWGCSDTMAPTFISCTL